MRLAGVSYRYGRRGPWVLRGVDLTVEPGQVAVVLGRNGAGKSTLLQIAAGVLRPSKGAVEDRLGPVGWVPERFPADQPFTVIDYLDAMARVGGGGEPGPWIERLGLAPYAGTKLAELSKGTAQKVGLAQALLRRPKLLVLDEPWEGLDAAARELVPELVAEVTAAGGAVLVSDHRGETARLPGATMWMVADGTVSAAEEADLLAPVPVAFGPASPGLTTTSPASPAPAAESAPPAPSAETDDTTESASTDHIVIEVRVPTQHAEHTVAELRAAGHDVRVRRP